ncbi:Serine/threonine-protein kinase [Hordeum vulgare]|nr:Serine/threonine-protein kinase [Hordeum vulgare]
MEISTKQYDIAPESESNYKSKGVASPPLGPRGLVVPRLRASRDARSFEIGLRFASPPAPATGMLLKVNSSGRMRVLSMAYPLTAAHVHAPRWL